VKSLAISNGDLVIGASGHATVSGSAKVKTDLRLALLESYGIDRFHPGWGSVLKDFVGETAVRSIANEVQTEITRVVNAYAEVRWDLWRKVRSGRLQASFSTGEVIEDVPSVQVVQSYDTFLIRVSLRTLSGEQLTLVQSVGG